MKKRNKKNQIKREVYARLTACFNSGKGRSRHEDKKAGLDKDRIYSDKTYYDYRKIAKDFVDWVKDRHPEYCHMKQCKKHINEWLRWMIDRELSPYTIATRKTAIMKLYGADSGDYISPPPRRRSDITRSRYTSSRDAHISKLTEANYARLTESMGVRRSELTRVKGTDLIIENGKPYIRIKGKGGKTRKAELLDDTGEIIELMRQAGDRPICPHVSHAYDNHAHRAVYARMLYNKYARPLDTIPKPERYYMRSDMKGTVLDRKAMLIVSKSLGHNRISVFADHYAYLSLPP